MGIFEMKVAIAIFAAADAGRIADDKPVTPLSRGISYCMGYSQAQAGAIPWQVSLQVGTSHFCGGSVLSTTKIASAAHCYQNSFNVVAGTVDNQSGQAVAGASFLQHPAYDSQNILNDFAVATTATPFTTNEYLQPIPLVSASSNRPAEGTELMTSGYGYYQKGPLGRPVAEVSRYLLYTDTYYVSVETCQGIWTSQTINDSIVCADKDGTSVCSGDSGGPLVMREDGIWKLLGATSWGQSFCNTEGMPQAWANMQSPVYNQWMRENA